MELAANGNLNVMNDVVFSAAYTFSQHMLRAVQASPAPEEFKLCILVFAFIVVNFVEKHVESYYAAQEAAVAGELRRPKPGGNRPVRAFPAKFYIGAYRFLFALFRFVFKACRFLYVQVLLAMAESSWDWRGGDPASYLTPITIILSGFLIVSVVEMATP